MKPNPTTRPSSPELLARLLLLCLPLGSLGVGPCEPQPLGSLADAATASGASVPEAPGPDAARTSTGVEDAATPAPTPPMATAGCGSRLDYDSCHADPSCRWLTPGCDLQRALPRPGCFSRAELDCAGDASCASGKRCAPHSINPCYQPPSPPPGTVSCAACGMVMNLCL